MKIIPNFGKSVVVICLLLLAPWCFAVPITLQIKINGVSPEIETNIENRFVIANEINKNLNYAKIQKFYAQSKKNIHEAIQPYGYFDAKVKSYLVRKGDTWIATFNINLGQPIIVREVDITLSGPGKNNSEILKVIRHFPLRRGDIFNSDTYDKGKNLIFETAANQGYLKITLPQKKVILDPVKHTAAITLNLDTGERYYFGKVSFKQKVLSDKFLHRFLNFKEGDPFSSEKLLQLQQDLSSSHFFSSVNIDPQINKAKYSLVPIVITTTAPKSQQYNVGLGFGSFTGPRATLGMKLNNFTKTGQHFNLQLKVSPVISGLTGEYVIPGSNPLTDEYAIGAVAQKFLPKNGHSISQTLYVGYTKKYGDWKSSLRLNYLREHYDIFAEHNAHNSRLFFPSLNLTKSTADDIINPTRGHKLEFNLRGASKQILSRTNFVQADAKAKVIYSPTEFSRMLVRGQFGYTVVKNLNVFPMSLQYFAGGMDSIRGFKTSYFGPGRYLKVGSLELQHKIHNEIWGAVYFDMGTANDHLNAAMGKGVGVGIIYNTLIGPIKVYVGRNYIYKRKPSFGYGFSIGPEF